VVVYDRTLLETASVLYSLFGLSDAPTRDITKIKRRTNLAFSAMTITVRLFDKGGSPNTVLRTFNVVNAGTQVFVLAIFDFTDYLTFSTYSTNTHALFVDSSTTAISVSPGLGAGISSSDNIYQKCAFIQTG
jgi:hypothetical protein